MRTAFTDLVGVPHPIVGFNRSPGVVAAVTNAGGFGVMSATHQPPDQQRTEVARLRELSGDRPFGLNHLLFLVEEDRFQATLELRPKVVSTAWPWPEQDLARFASAAHGAGALTVTRSTPGWSISRR